jgi:hypothetical protein
MSKLNIVLFITLAIGLCSNQSFAGNGPCEQIKNACSSAGFVVKEAKIGKGLWHDCVDPIMQGTTASKSVLPLPTVDPTVVAACKAKHPNFGEGKVGN